ncbi:MAG: PqqD family protein [Anaerolineales bacterium]|nr:PqqD family protein [Anaerolineales bacterium]
MTIESHTVLSRVEELLTTQVDDDLVILNPATDNYIALDKIGRRIWELLETPRRVDDLCQQLSREFNGSLEQITADVLAFLQELEGEKMLRFQHEP